MSAYDGHRQAIIKAFEYFVDEVHRNPDKAEEYLKEFLRRRASADLALKTWQNFIDSQETSDWTPSPGPGPQKHNLAPSDRSLEDLMRARENSYVMVDGRKSYVHMADDCT